MSEIRIDPLALYAGLDLTNPVASLSLSPAVQAIAHIFKRAEQITNLLYTQENKRKNHSNLESNDQLSKRGRHN